MSYLLDTCTLIWMAAEPARLSDKVRTLLDDELDLYLSDVSVWEVCLKWEAGKMKLPQPPRAWCEAQSMIWRLLPLPIERAHLYRVSELPAHHRDPFDRLLIGQALENELTLLTPDEQIHRYPVPWTW